MGNARHKNAGFGIIDALVAIGLFSIIMAGTLKMLDFQLQSQKTAENSLKVTNISTLATLVLSNSTSCKASLGNLTFPMGNIAQARIPITHLDFNGTSGPAVSVQTPQVAKDSVYVSAMEVSDLVKPNPSDNTKYIGVVKISAEKRGGLGMKISLLKLPVSITTTVASGTATITDCQMGGGSSGSSSSIGSCENRHVGSTNSNGTFACSSNEKLEAWNLTCGWEGSNAPESVVRGSGTSGTYSIVYQCDVGGYSQWEFGEYVKGNITCCPP